MEMRNSFTKDELAIAKGVDLTAVAGSLGYTVRRVGRYHTLAEMDSIRIYSRRSWFRWSREYDKGQNGGSQIDFLRVFAGMGVKEAVFWLLDFAGHQGAVGWEPRQAAAGQGGARRESFALPLPASGNGHLYQYLMGERGLSKEAIDFFVRSGLIYEECRHHNIVFKGNDKGGTTRFASMRGVFDRDGKCFKCDVAGSDKHFGFNVWNGESAELVVFEGAIDLMSYADIHNDFHSNKLALGMLSDAPLVTFLKEHPQVQNIKLCLDNDRPGREATLGLVQKYRGLGYGVTDCPPPRGCKDYNQWLQEARKTNLGIGDTKGMER